MILWLLGAIVLYFVLKKKDTVQEAEVGYSGARVGTGDYTTGTKPNIPVIITNPSQQTAIPGFTQTPKVFSKIVNNSGSYSDNTDGDYEENGVTFRNANGRKYRALYWLNERPLVKLDGTPKSFKNIILKNGLIVTMRKEYADVTWVGSNSHVAFKNSGWDIWLHGNPPENPNAKDYWLLATVLTDITTNGGANLVNGQLIRKVNPTWLSASTYAPQFFSNPAEFKTSKPVALQAFPVTDNAADTLKKLADAGINHLWWENFASIGGFENENVGIDRRGIKVAYNNNSIQFHNANPDKPIGVQANRDQARHTADMLTLRNGDLITNEFSEGSDPQLEQSREWYAERINERIIAGGLTDVINADDYGYGSQNFSLLGKDPLGAYALSLNTPDVVANLENVGGSNNTKFKQYAQGAYNYRDTILGRYYAISFLDTQRTANSFLEAMVTINATPNRSKGYFCASLMQSNGHGADVPYKDSGTILADGSISKDYPNVPAEMMKTDAFYSLLLHQFYYYWASFGRKNISSTWSNCNIGLDAAVVGTRWFGEIESRLNQAGEIHTCDFVSNGAAFNSTTTNRRIARKGQQQFNNKYFNEIMKYGVGMGLCIPSTKKVFIYQNDNLSPDMVERVTIKHNGISYDMGEIAGSTMGLFFEP